jgi:hypothetical protein
MKMRSRCRTQPPCSTTRSLLAAVCGAILLWGSCSAAAQPAPAAAARVPRGAEANLLVLEVVLDRHVLSDSFIAYQDGSQVLLPLGELSRLLTLAINVQPSEGTARGFVIREERGFALNVGEAIATVQGRAKSFEPRMATVIGDEIYVSSRLLAHWLPINLAVDLGRLQLQITPRERLPLQERLDREDQGARLRNAGAQPLDLGYPLAHTPYAMAAVPFVDQTFAAQALAGPAQHEYQATYTGYFTGDLLGMEAAVYVATHRDSVKPAGTADGADRRDVVATPYVVDGSSSDLRVTLARHDPEAGLLGPLHARTLAAGTILLPSVPNVTLGSPQGNGVLVSNRPLDQPTSFDRQTFRGSLPPGWDVTLYYNDALVGYQASRADGQYSFEDLPLLFGPNEFRLVFNGPLGQVRVERRSFLLDRSMLTPGQTYYTVAQHRAGHGEDRTVVQIDQGLTSTLAANAALIRTPRLGGNDERVYAQAGLRGYFESMILGAQLTAEPGRGSLGELSMKTRLLGQSIDLIHLQRQGQFESDGLDVAGGLRFRDVVRATGTWRSAALAPITYAFETARDALAGSHSQVDVSGRVSTVLRGTAVSNTFTWVRGDGADSAAGTLQVSRRMFDMGLSLLTGYSMRPRGRLDSLSLNADRSLGDAYRLSAGVQRSMDTSLTLASVGLTKNLGRFGLGVNASYSSKREIAIGVQLFMAIGREPRSGAWMVDALPLAGTGAVSARAFVDKNMNGVRDPGEDVVSNAGFILNGGGRHPARTGDDGTAFIGRLTPGQYADLALDPATLEDPQWKPLTPGVRVLPRPGVVDVIEFPVVATSEIDGTVYLSGEHERRGIGAARIELVDADGHVVASTESSSDGYYLLHQVLPGRYTLRIALDQTERLGLQKSQSRLIAAPVEGDFINGQDFELKPAAPK